MTQPLFSSQETYPFIVLIERSHLEIAGFSKEQLGLLTDVDMQLLVEDMVNRYVTGDFWKHLWCAARIIIEEKEKTMPPKNPCGKTVKPENAYEVWASADETWKYYVLKKYKTPENEAQSPYSRWYCFVTSPASSCGEYGDVYRTTVLDGTHLIVNPLCTDKQTSGEQNEAHKA